MSQFQVFRRVLVLVLALWAQGSLQAQRIKLLQLEQKGVPREGYFGLTNSSGDQVYTDFTTSVTTIITANGHWYLNGFDDAFGSTTISPGETVSFTGNDGSFRGIVAGLASSGSNVLFIDGTALQWNLGANGSYTTIGDVQGSSESVNFVGAGSVTTSRSANTITITGTNSGTDWDLGANGSYTNINNGEQVDFVGSGIASTSRSSNTITITATEVDGSVSNELQTIAVTGTTTGITTLSNSGGSMTIAAAGINSIGVSGSTITITATEVDGSVTNEAQTWSNSGTTSYTGTLSTAGGAGGGSFTIAAGSNVTVSHSAGTVTIASTAGATDLTFTGASSPYTLNSSTGTDVTFASGGIISLSRSANELTISATEVDGSVSNELQTIAVTGTTTGITTLSNSGGSMTIAAAGINSIGVSGSTITITATEVDGSVTNEAQTWSNSGTTSYTGTLSTAGGAGGGSFTIAAGSNVTVSHSAGTVTIASTDQFIGTVTSVSIIAPAAGITQSGSPITSSGSITLGLANDLAALEALTGFGIPVRTSSETYTMRTITAGTGISVTNGDGVSGNPVINSTVTPGGGENIDQTLGIGSVTNDVIEFEHNYSSGYSTGIIHSQNPLMPLGTTNGYYLRQIITSEDGVNATVGRWLESISENQSGQQGSPTARKNVVWSFGYNTDQSIANEGYLRFGIESNYRPGGGAEWFEWHAPEVMTRDGTISRWYSIVGNKASPQATHLFQGSSWNFQDITNPSDNIFQFDNENWLIKGGNISFINKDNINTKLILTYDDDDIYLNFSGSGTAGETYISSDNPIYFNKTIRTGNSYGSDVQFGSTVIDGYGGTFNLHFATIGSIAGGAKISGAGTAKVDYYSIELNGFSGNTTDEGGVIYFDNRNLRSAISFFTKPTGTSTPAYSAGINGGDGFWHFGTTDGAVPSQRVHVEGNVRVTGAYYDSNNEPGTSGQMLSSTVTGTDWVPVATSNADLTWTDGGTSVTLVSSSGTDVNILESTGYTLSASGANLTLTLADNSSSNELQVLASGGGVTTLSNGGGSIQFVAGSNITITPSGTSLDGVYTIAATGSAYSFELAANGNNTTINSGAFVNLIPGGIISITRSGFDYTFSSAGTNLSFTDHGAYLDLVSSTGNTLFIHEGSGISLSASGADLTITNSSPNLHSGTGTANYVTKWTDTYTLGNSQIQDDASSVGIGGAPNGSYKATVYGNLKLGTTLHQQIWFGDGSDVYVGEAGSDGRLNLKGTLISLEIGGSFGSSGYVLTSNGTTASWAAVPATDLTFTGSGPFTLNSSTGTDVTFTEGSNIDITRTSNDLSFTATPAGSNTYVQYNNSGSFGSDAEFSFNSTTDVLTSGNYILGDYVGTGPAGGVLYLTSGAQIKSTHESTGGWNYFSETRGFVGDFNIASESSATYDDQVVPVYSAQGDNAYGFGLLTATTGPLNFQVISTSTDITDSGVYINVTGSGVTVGIPASAQGRVIYIINNSGGNITIDPASTGTIDGYSTKVMAAGEWCMLFSYQVNVWYYFGN